MNIQKFHIECKFCRSKNIVKRGIQQTKSGCEQLFCCKDCGRKFSLRKMRNKVYNPKVIANAICAYNLGNTLEDAAKIVNQRFKVSATKSSVHRWIEEFRDICTYHKLRQSVVENTSENPVAGKSFAHNGLSYDFKYHTPKLALLCSNGFSGMASYVKGFEHGCPDKFFTGSRCSQTRIDVKIAKEGKYNNACRLADLALRACNRNKDRHATVENFMLVNDSSTVACEVPVWLWEKNLNTGISGHVDILQVRNGHIYILDFKPDAAFENEQKVASQLFLYASGLSFRSKIPLVNFMCAWFDEKGYYEFNPKDATIRFRDSKL